MQVVCCFCAGSLDEPAAVMLAAFPPGVRDESQGLYAHPWCFRDTLHPAIPLHPDITDARG